MTMDAQRRLEGMIGITIWLNKNQGENAGPSKSSNDNYSSKKKNRQNY